MKTFAAYRSAISLLPLLLTKHVVGGHFIFADLEEDERNVRVFFSEPVAIEGEGISYLGGRVQQLAMIGPSQEDPVVIELKDSGSGFLTGSLPDLPLDNTPFFLTGFLDYGDFGEGDGPKKDLQYTFSTQISSTNPSDDFSHFLHPVVGTNAESPFDEGDPFTIALKNFGPPYRVVMRGVSATTPVRVCIYEGNGSNRQVGCVEGSHNRTHHLTFDSIDAEVLRPCETYFALANATVTDEESGKTKSLWSSTSAMWNGPCAKDQVRSPVPQWFAQSTFRGGCRTPSAATATKGATVAEATEGASSLSSSGSGFVTVALVFASGLMAGMLVFRVMQSGLSCCDQNQQSGGDHSKLDSTEDEDETVAYADDSTEGGKPVVEEGVQLT